MDTRNFVVATVNCQKFDVLTLTIGRYTMAYRVQRVKRRCGRRNNRKNSVESRPGVDKLSQDRNPESLNYVISDGHGDSKLTRRMQLNCHDNFLFILWYRFKTLLDLWPASLVNTSIQLCVLPGFTEVFYRIRCSNWISAFVRNFLIRFPCATKRQNCASKERVQSKNVAYFWTQWFLMIKDISKRFYVV